MMGGDVQQETPDELVGGKGHRAIRRSPGAAVILVAEGDAALLESKMRQLFEMATRWV